MNLFEDNIGLVKLFVERLDYGYVEKEDLYQAGLMGLFEACRKYNESIGTKFSTYASFYIMGEIKKELRENRLIKYNKEVCKVKREISKMDEHIDLDLLKQKTNVNENIIKDVYLNHLEIVKLEDEKIDLLKNGNKSIFVYMQECLTDIYYKVIKMRYIDGYSQQDISHIINISQSKVSRIEKIGLKKLKKYYINYNNN